MAAYANSTKLGNLDQADKRVQWMGTPGMKWCQLLPAVQFQMMFNHPPALILIHLGGNDLVSIKQARLMKSIKRDLNYIASVFPHTLLVWSDILPRKLWRGMVNTPTSLARINEKRKRVNRAGRQVIRGLQQGRYIIHEIETITTGLFHEDGTHLTRVGNAIFLTALLEACRIFVNDAGRKFFNANL